MVDRGRLAVLFTEEYKSFREIGLELGVSHEYVRKIALQMGLERPPRVCAACRTGFQPTAGGQDRCPDCVAHERTAESVERAVARAETDVASGWKICPSCNRKLSRAAFTFDTYKEADSSYCKACQSKRVGRARVAAVRAGTIGNKVLSDSDKRRACEYLAAETYTQSELARMFGVSQTTISNVWKSRDSRA